MIRRHIRFSSTKHRVPIKSWKSKMEGVPVFIIGNAPSLNDVPDITVLAPYFTIGINRAFYKIDPTILMWQDIETWYTERKRILKLSALKVCRNVADPQNRFFHFKLSTGDFVLPTNAHHLHGRGSTGPLAVQLAHVLGCNPIILLGCDCMARGDSTDFYGRNRYHKMHSLPNCKRGLEWIRDEVKDREVISCSENDYIPHKKLDDILKRLGKDAKKQRSHWVSMLTQQ